MNAIEILTKELQGNFISRFSVGDTWELLIGDYCLIAQDISSEDEQFLNELYENYYSTIQKCVDRGNISKSTIVAAHLRKKITGIELDKSYNLKIEFEEDSKLIIPTNVGFVDWQWCLNKSGKDPYQEYLVACFWKGEIEIKV